MDLSCFPFLPLLFFLKDRRGGRERKKAGQQAVRQQLPASDRVRGTFLISSYIKLGMCTPIVWGYWVTPREQSVPQIPPTTHDQVMQAGQHNARRLFHLSGTSGLVAAGLLYFTHPLSLSHTTPRLLQSPPRPEFRTSHWTGHLSKCKH